LIVGGQRLAWSVSNLYARQKRTPNTHELTQIHTYIQLVVYVRA